MVIYGGDLTPSFNDKVCSSVNLSALEDFSCYVLLL